MENKQRNKKKCLILLIFLLLLFFVLFFFLRSRNSIETSENPSSEEVTVAEDLSETNKKTPEQVLLELEAVENPEPQGPLSAEIVSPKEDTFMMSQARLYRAEIVNGLSNYYKKTECNWKFYLNEYSEEVLYKEQTVPMTGGNTCGFTSTFIDKRGKLRVVLEVVLLDKETGEILDTFITEKNYLVD